MLVVIRRKVGSVEGMSVAVAGGSGTYTRLRGLGPVHCIHKGPKTDITGPRYLRYRYLDPLGSVEGPGCGPEGRRSRESGWGD